VKEKYLYQSLPYADGIAYDELQGLRTPKISPVYATLASLKHNDLRMAARGTRIANSVIEGMMAWYEILKQASYKLLMN
jgi:hypothetical protein